MTAFEYLRTLHETCMFQTREGAKVGVASNSELKRWCNNGALTINGEKLKADANIKFPINQSTLFTKQAKITLL